MTLKRSLVSLALIAGGALVLAGCSSPDSSTQNLPAGSSSPSPSASAAPKDAGAQPWNSGGFLGGNATPTVADGEEGKVSVVATGALDTDSGTLLMAFRNNTSAAISHVDFTGTATAGGKIVASGSSQGTIPAQVQPGEPGFAYIYFSDTASIQATGTEYAFKSTTLPADTSSFNTAPLTVTQADNNGTAIIGAATNNTKKALTGPYSVDIYCLSGNDLVKEIGDFATESGDIEAGATVSFSTDLYGDSCETFAVGVSGYFK